LFSYSTNIKNCWITNRDKKDFFFSWHLTNLRKCHLQSKNLEKLIFVSKNWPNDARVDYKSPSDLAKFIAMDEQFKKKLQEFEGEFEQDEIQNK
jgi:hypothetical protein